jgi:hypothetical protein
VWLFISGLSLSGLIYLQQWETRKGHAKEIAELATKEDVARLPTIQQIGIEFRKATTEQSPQEVVSPKLSSKRSNTESVGARANEGPSEPVKHNPDEQIVKGIDDIKHMLGSQRWGLSADQLVTLTRRMAPFARTVNAWPTGGGDLITSVLGDPDSNKLATSLIAALRAAGWNLPGNGMSMAIFNGRPQGVIFVLHSKEDASLPVLNQFVVTLKEAGVDFHGELHDAVPSGQFKIIVGGKPDQ